jgi:thiosulfate reductase cytochrome b subunit
MQVTQRHARWVRATHWIGAASVLALAFSGFVILMAHPRLYWGNAGNDLTPALLELPISRNHRHGGWTTPTPFAAIEAASQGLAAPISASRTYDIFNKNGWGRSLHFLAAWGLVATGAIYLLGGVLSGHVRAHLIPRPGELTARHLARELADHLRLRIRPATGGPQYGLLQKCAYTCVVFVVLPLTALTGLTMSPAITAAFPFLLTLFGGVQSARTIHFALWAILVLFVVGHLLMVVLSGFRRQLRAMTVGD